MICNFENCENKCYKKYEFCLEHLKEYLEDESIEYYNYLVKVAKQEHRYVDKAFLSILVAEAYNLLNADEVENYDINDLWEENYKDFYKNLPNDRSYLPPYSDDEEYYPDIFVMYMLFEDSFEASEETYNHLQVKELVYDSYTRVKSDYSKWHPDLKFIFENIETLHEKNKKMLKRVRKTLLKKK